MVALDYSVFLHRRPGLKGLTRSQRLVQDDDAAADAVMTVVQAQSLPSELVSKVLGAGVSVGPIVTIEPRRRKFHKPITVTLPLPWELQSSATKYNVNNLRLLCSIAGS